MHSIEFNKIFWPIKMKLAVLGTKGFVKFDENISNQKILSSCGENTGNLMFQYAIFELLRTQNELFYLDEMPDEQSVEILKTCSFLVIPCADFLTFEYDLEGLWSRIEWSNIPIIAIGLGISASFDLLKLEKMGKYTSLVLNHFKNYADLIFVRGEKTKEALITLNFDSSKIYVTGCPSNFHSTNDFLRKSFSEKTQKPLPNFNDSSFLLYGDRYWDEEKVSFERLLYKLFRLTKKSSWVLQSHMPIIDISRPTQSQSNFYTMVSDLAFLKDSLNPEGSFYDLIDDIQSRYKIFFDIKDWMIFSGNYDFSLGLRLHGNMVSFQSGIPTLWYVHDNRTNELAELMKLPTFNFFDLQALIASKKLDEIFYKFEFLLSEYFIRRSELFFVFMSALKSKGIDIKSI